MQFSRNDIQIGSPLQGFRDRTHSSLSSAGRRFHSPLGNDLLLLQMVPTTPDAHMRRRRGFSASTFPLGGLRGGGGSGGGSLRGRADEFGWPGYLGRLEQKRLMRCQCSGCSDDSCSSSSYKYPAVAATQEEEEEDVEGEQQMVPSFGPFFDNESYYNSHGCFRKERWKGAIDYDDVRPKRPGLYDVPMKTRRHQQVALCGKHAFEKTTTCHHETDHHDQDEVFYDDEQEVVCHHQLEQTFDRPIIGQHNVSRQRPEYLQKKSFSKGADDHRGLNASKTLDSSHRTCDRTMEWSTARKTNGRRRRGKTATTVSVCRKCFVCQLKEDESKRTPPANQHRAYQDGVYQDGAYQDRAYQEGAYQDRANQDRANQDRVYQQMNAVPKTKHLRRLRSDEDESSYVLTDRASTNEEAGQEEAGREGGGGGGGRGRRGKGRNGLDYVVPGQRISGGLRPKENGLVASEREDLPAADEGYLIPLSSIKEQTKTDNEINQKQEDDKETERQSPLPMQNKDLGYERKKTDSLGSGDDNVSQPGLESRKGQREETRFFSSKEIGSAVVSEEKNNSLRRKKAEGGSSSRREQLGADQLQDELNEGFGKEISCRETLDEEEGGGVGSEIHRPSKAGEDYVNEERDNIEGKDQTKGKSLSEEEEEEKKKRATSLLQVVLPSTSVSQLDLLLMSPPPQCFQMVSHSYTNVSSQVKTKGAEVGCKEVVVVHRGLWLDEEEEEHDSYDIHQLQRRKTQPNEGKFYCSTRQSMAGNKHLLKPEVEEEEEEEEEEGREWELGRCQGQNGSPSYLTSLLKKTSLEYDFYHTHIPPMDESLRSTCLAT